MVDSDPNDTALLIDQDGAFLGFTLVALAIAIVVKDSSYLFQIFIIVCVWALVEVGFYFAQKQFPQYLGKLKKPVERTPIKPRSTEIKSSKEEIREQTKEQVKEIKEEVKQTVKETVKEVKKEEPIVKESKIEKIVETPSVVNEDEKKERIVYGFASDIGRRESNEDAHIAIYPLDDKGTAIFGVFDGHGGANASHYCAEELPKNLTERKSFQTDKRKAISKAFAVTDENYLLDMPEDGCTACVAVLTAENQLYVANLGDSRCVVIKGGNTVAMTTDHKPNLPEEKQRIEDSGHTVDKDTALVGGKRIVTWRIDRKIAVSRSIGDAEFKDNLAEGPEKQAMSSVPEISEESLSSGDSIVIACDGLWDVMTNDEVTQHVIANKTQKPEDICRQLIDMALERGSEDNITVVLVFVQ
eukprot:TRINITY_DN1177_c0_g1_i1.p1 TRINITY_DN1177_c0_g1~~TRINITY_DN1177_c0_g1_i1.p1  ORF type:complete len:414 (-),score=130.23 TRINITY_DN1177_c0_g1_i1:89-1330(-)